MAIKSGDIKLLPYQQDFLESKGILYMPYHNKYSGKGFESKWVPQKVSEIPGAYIDVIKIVGTSYNCNHELPRGVKRSDFIKKFFISTSFESSSFSIISLKDYLRSFDVLHVIGKSKDYSKFIQVRRDLENKYDEFAIGVYVSLEDDEEFTNSGGVRTKCVYDVGFFPRQISKEIHSSFKEFYFINAQSSGRGMEIGMLFLEKEFKEDQKKEIIEEINTFSEFRSLIKMRRFLRS